MSPYYSTLDKLTSARPSGWPARSSKPKTKKRWKTKNGCESFPGHEWSVCLFLAQKVKVQGRILHCSAEL